MRRFALLLLIAAAPALILPGAEKPAVPGAGVVINTAENMHSRSNAMSDVVSQALLGTNVRILKTERNSDGEDWYYVETPDTYKGWVIGPSLRFLKPGDKPYAAQGKIFVVTALLANTYREPDVTKRKPVKVAPISSVLEVTRDADARWLEVALPCGTKAWNTRRATAISGKARWSGRGYRPRRWSPCRSASSVSPTSGAARRLSVSTAPDSSS